MQSQARDADLIARARAGNADALAGLYHRYAGEPLTLAARLTGSRADAEDLLHDLFVGLPEALRRYEDRGAFAGWIRRVAVRMALMRMRTVRRRAEVTIDAAAEVAGPTVERDAPAVAAIERAIAELSPALRAVFLLREVEGYSHQE